MKVVEHEGTEILIIGTTIPGSEDSDEVHEYHLSQPSGAGGEDKTKYTPGRLVTQCFPSQVDEHH